MPPNMPDGIKTSPDVIYVDQAKYILEQIHPLALGKGRRSQPTSPLTTEEFTGPEIFGVQDKLGRPRKST